MGHAVDVGLIHGTWLHRHEEGGDGLVFVRSGTDLPPSRGRTVLTFRPDGALVVGAPGPDDRPSDAAGSWRLDGDVLTIEAPVLAGTYRVVAAGRDRLVIHEQD